MFSYFSLIFLITGVVRINSTWQRSMMDHGARIQLHQLRNHNNNWKTKKWNYLSASSTTTTATNNWEKKWNTRTKCKNEKNPTNWKNEKKITAKQKSETTSNKLTHTKQNKKPTTTETDLFICVSVWTEKHLQGLTVLITSRVENKCKPQQSFIYFSCHASL